MAAHLTPLAAALLDEPPERRIRAILGEFGVAEAREAISGDVQLARRFDEISLRRWPPPFCATCPCASRAC